MFLTATWEDVLPLMPDGSVDTVMALDVIEHMEKEEGLRLLHEAKRIARHQVVVFTPLGFFPQSHAPDELDRWHMHGGRWQSHRSGWEPEEFGREWQIVACRDLHLTDQDGGALEEPVGAFWAVYGEAPPVAPATPAEPEPSAARVERRRATRRPGTRRLPKKPRILFVAMGQQPARGALDRAGRGPRLGALPLPVERHAPIPEVLRKLAPQRSGGRGLAVKGSRPSGRSS